MSLFNKFYLNRKLVRAVKKNDVQAAANLLDQGANPQARHLLNFGLPVLHMAAAGGYEEMAMLLISKNADVSRFEEIGRTMPLHEAAKTGNVSIVRAMLDKGASINDRTGDGNTALHYATLYGHKNLTVFLLNNGAGVDVKNARNETPLHLSAGHENADIPALLIEKGANINATSGYNWTPLHMAAFRNDTAMTALLLSKNADITIRSTDDNKTAYGLALVKGHASIIELIAPHEKKIQEERDNQWMMLSDKKVVRIYIEGEGDVGCALQARQITELFNFKTRRYKAWSRNLTTNAESFTTRGFDDLYKSGEKALLDEAWHEMRRLDRETRLPGVATPSAGH